MKWFRKWFNTPVDPFERKIKQINQSPNLFQKIFKQRVAAKPDTRGAEIKKGMQAMLKQRKLNIKRAHRRSAHCYSLK